jgi:hypothetical protein
VTPDENRPNPATAEVCLKADQGIWSTGTRRTDDGFSQIFQRNRSPRGPRRIEPGQYRSATNARLSQGVLVGNRNSNMNTGTIELYDRAGHGREFSLGEHARMVGCGQVGAGKDWSSVKPPPQGWEHEVPKYRARFDVQPPKLARLRLEPPQEMAADIWQYGERAYKTGETIETKAWPHASFMPLNYGAERVLEFFNTRMRSRLATTPWEIDRLRLDDGLTGNITVVDMSRTPKPAPAPVSAPPPVRHSMRRV